MPIQHLAPSAASFLASSLWSFTLRLSFSNPITTEIPQIGRRVFGGEDPFTPEESGHSGVCHAGRTRTEIHRKFPQKLLAVPKIDSCLGLWSLDRSQRYHPHHLPSPCSCPLTFTLSEAVVFSIFLPLLGFCLGLSFHC